jgi:hypothetical protein
MSWTIFLQADPDFDSTAKAAFFGAELSTYQSSDGDDQLHPSSALLDCKVTRR